MSVDNGQTDIIATKSTLWKELSDGTIKCQYGRVGRSLVVEVKPVSKWDECFKTKTKQNKGLYRCY
jgi:hypothetical protein